MATPVTFGVLTVVVAFIPLYFMAGRWGLLMTGGSDNHGDRDGMSAMRASRVPRSLATELLERIDARRKAMGTPA